MEVTEETTSKTKAYENLSYRKFFKTDFRGMDLKNVPMHHSEFICCDFTEKDGVKTDISGNDCSHSRFNGSNMTGIKCNNTNFMHTVFACRFYPSDAYGMTITLNCATFKGILISKLWWMCFIYFALIMIPEKDKGMDMRDGIISALGQERFLKLKSMFDSREI